MFGGHSSIISSYLDWWANAGLLDAVRDEPMDWLAPVAKAAPVVAPSRPAAAPATLNDAGQAVRPAAPAPAAQASAPAEIALPPMPGDLAAFDAWLAAHPALPGAIWSPATVLPQGPAEPRLMIIADVPDQEDISAGHLFSGVPGRMLDAMLVAIGLDRAAVRLASIGYTRPPAGRLDGPDVAPLLAMTLHHIGLARPKALLLIGQQTCSLLTGEVVPPDGQGQRQINHSGANTAAFAIHHPRLLLKQPLLKRSAWTALKRLKELELT